MTKVLLVTALLLAPVAASAQVVIQFGWTAPPPLVEVSPGVQIVEDGGSEVFFMNGRYWVERDGRWYWARDYREQWRYAEVRRVPVFLRNHRRGEYVHWRRADHVRGVRNGQFRREVRHDRRPEQREVHHEAQREVHHERAREVEHRGNGQHGGDGDHRRDH